MPSHDTYDHRFPFRQVRIQDINLCGKRGKRFKDTSVHILARIAKL